MHLIKRNENEIIKYLQFVRSNKFLRLSALERHPQAGY